MWCVVMRFVVLCWTCVLVVLRLIALCCVVLCCVVLRGPLCCGKLFRVRFDCWGVVLVLSCFVLS